MQFLMLQNSGKGDTSGFSQPMAQNTSKYDCLLNFVGTWGSRECLSLK